MAERKMVTTIRIDAETLYAARHALNLRGLSVAKFVTRKLEEVVHEYRTQQAPSGRPPATGTPSAS